MAIVEMSKIKLVGVNAHREKILDALYKTGCVELVETEEFTDTFRVSSSGSIDEISVLHDEIGRVIDFYTDVIEKSKNKKYYPKNAAFLKNFFVSYDEFIRSESKKSAVFNVVEKVQGFIGELSLFKSETTKLLNFNTGLIPYVPVNEKLSDFI